MEYGLYFSCPCPNCRKDLQITIAEKKDIELPKERDDYEKNMGRRKEQKILYKEERPHRVY